MLEHEGWSCERHLPKDGPVRGAFFFFLNPCCETGSLLTKQEGTSVRLGARTPNSGVTCGHSPAGDRPKERRAPTPKLDRHAATFLTTTQAATSWRSLRLAPPRRVGVQFAKLPYALLEVVLQQCLASWYAVLHSVFFSALPSIASSRPLHRVHGMWLLGHVHLIGSHRWIGSALRAGSARKFPG